MAEEKELSVSADTLAQTEQALKRLDGLEANAQVSQSTFLNNGTCNPTCMLYRDRLRPLSALSGGGVSSSDHHPSRSPAFGQSPLRHGSHHAALQRASPPL